MSHLRDKETRPRRGNDEYQDAQVNRWKHNDSYNTALEASVKSLREGCRKLEFSLMRQNIFPIRAFVF